MTEVRINGETKQIPVGANADFGEVMDYVETHCLGADRLIGSISLEGREIGTDQRDELARTRVSELPSIEITVVHPRQMAVETVDLITRHAVNLSELSRTIAGEYLSDRVHPRLGELVEGVQTLVDGVTWVKMLLKAHSISAVQVLEADLLSILKDLLEAHESKDPQQRQYARELLGEHLPKNLSDWCTDGLPRIALFQSK